MVKEIETIDLPRSEKSVHAFGHSFRIGAITRYCSVYKGNGKAIKLYGAMLADDMTSQIGIHLFCALLPGDIVIDVSPARKEAKALSEQEQNTRRVGLRPRWFRAILRRRLLVILLLLVQIAFLVYALRSEYKAVEITLRATASSSTTTPRW